jgi:hypothetical protein
VQASWWVLCCHGGRIPTMLTCAQAIDAEINELSETVKQIQAQVAGMGERLTALEAAAVARDSMPPASLARYLLAWWEASFGPLKREVTAGNFMAALAGWMAKQEG